MTDTIPEALKTARNQWDEALVDGLDVDAVLGVALEWVPVMFETIEALRAENANLRVSSERLDPVSIQLAEDLHYTRERAEKAEAALDVSNSLREKTRARLADAVAENAKLRAALEIAWELIKPPHEMETMSLLPDNDPFPYRVMREHTLGHLRTIHRALTGAGENPYQAVVEAARVVLKPVKYRNEYDDRPLHPDWKVLDDALAALPSSPPEKDANGG